MKYLIFMIALNSLMNTLTIVDFTTKTNLSNWRVVDDVVMGGRSSGTFKINTDGHGVFEGEVSLENNGGFSSVRLAMEKTPIEGFTKVVIKLKGDGKQYQFRVKSKTQDYYSYIATFSTSGAWEEIAIPLADMYPSYRGRKLDLPNFSDTHLEELRFLIGNKKPEYFKLIIDKIELK